MCELYLRSMARATVVRCAWEISDEGPAFGDECAVDEGIKNKGVIFNWSIATKLVRQWKRVSHLGQ